MEKVSQALAALQAKQKQAEEMSQTALNDYEQNLKAILTAEELTFKSGIAKASQTASEENQAYQQQLTLLYKQAQIQTNDYLKAQHTKFEQYNTKTLIFAKSAFLLGLGIIGISSMIGGSILIWSWKATSPQELVQLEGLRLENSDLRQKISELQQKIKQLKPKPKK